MLMKLGNFTFQLNTAAYQKLSRRSQYNWQKFKRLNNKPAQQFLGHNADQMIIDGVIYPTFKGGLRQVQVMREEASKGTDHLLVSGLGEVMGQWIIISIDETHEVFTKQGAPLKITFKMTIEEYAL